VVYLLLHQRSWNKVLPHVRALQSLDVKVSVVSDLPIVDCDLGAPNIVVGSFEDLDVLIERLKALDQKVRYISTVSENLLPVVTRLEEVFDLEVQIPYESACILADKYQFELKLSQSGFLCEMPQSWVPTSLEEFSHIDYDGPVIVKPTVGSGSNIYFPKQADVPRFEYIRWENREALKVALESEGFLDHFFHLNKVGVKNDRFNSLPSRFQIQPYYWSDNFTTDFHGFVASGEHKIFSQSHVSRMGEGGGPGESLENSHESGRDAVYSRERAAWFTEKRDQKLVKTQNKLIEFLTQEMGVRNLIYAGPSWFNSYQGWVGIDFNPRIGGMLSLGFHRVGQSLLSEIWRMWLGLPLSDSSPHLDQLCLWGAIQLQPGVVKNYVPPNLPKDVEVYGTQALVSGFQIPEYVSLQTKAFSPFLMVYGDTEKEIKDKYLEANQQIVDSLSLS
jgi:hypothetical protein